MAGVEDKETHEEMKRMYHDMSWHLQGRRSFVMDKSKMDPVPGELEDNLSSNGDYRLHGLFYLCSHCGYLSSTRTKACQSCHSKEWLDLRDVEVSKTLRYTEVHSQQRVSTTTIILMAFIHLGIFVALTAGVTSSFPVGYNWSNIAWKYPLAGWYWILAPILLLTSFYYSTRYLDKWLRRFAKTRPMRWHLPAVNHFAKDVESLLYRHVSGHCQGEASLIAPFSQRKCIGYRVSILSCDNEGTHPPQWLLEECRSEPCTLAGEPIGRDKLTFQMSGEQLEIESKEMQNKFQLFLHQHGLFSQEGNFWVFETVLNTNDTVSATIYPDHQLGIVTQIEKSIKPPHIANSEMQIYSESTVSK